MADPNDLNPPTNGATPPAAEEPRKSLREIAEASWDEVESGDPGTVEIDPAAPPVDDGSQPRDAHGRFVPKSPDAKPGEAETPPGVIPAPTDPNAPQAAKPVIPAPSEGSSREPPQHWSSEHRAMFAKLPPEGQAFLLDRHTEMERDYQGKAQASATAVQFTQALAPIFQDPVVSGSLQQVGASPYDAIEQWAGFHKRAMDPNPAVKLALLQELGQRMGLNLNPAALGQMSQPSPTGAQLSEADLKDPAIRYFADHIGKTLTEVQTLRANLQQMQKADADRQNAEALKAHRWNIDSFAEEKDQQGNLLRPHFDAVIPMMMELYKANPDRDLKSTYETAIWMVPEVREKLFAAQRATADQQQNNQRARQAVRSNVRGITSPVSKPASNGEAKGLRAAIESAADEVGLT